MRLSRLAIAFYVALVFMSGVLLGAFGYRLYTISTVSAKTTRNPEEFRRKYLEEMRTRLHLTADQVTRLNAILDETRARFHEAHAKVEPEIKAIRSEQVEKVRSILHDEQRAEYDRMRKEREERMKQGGGHPGPGI